LRDTSGHTQHQWSLRPDERRLTAALVCGNWSHCHPQLHGWVQALREDLILRQPLDPLLTGFFRTSKVELFGQLFGCRLMELGLLLCELLGPLCVSLCSNSS
jgi:hypothetical protein